MSTASDADVLREALKAACLDLELFLFPLRRVDQWPHSEAEIREHLATYRAILVREQ